MRHPWSLGRIATTSTPRSTRRRSARFDVASVSPVSWVFLVCVIDTPGAALSKEAEERGLASEIARTLSELITLHTPTVSLLMGQGPVASPSR